MKKLFILLCSAVLIVMITLPTFAELVPTVDGSYTPPPSSTSGTTGITTDFNLHYSYTNMLLFVGGTNARSVVNTDGTNYTRYPVIFWELPRYYSTYFPQIGTDTIYGPGYPISGAQQYYGSGFSSNVISYYPSSADNDSLFNIISHTEDYITMGIKSSFSYAKYAGTGIVTGERHYYETGGLDYDVDGFAIQPTSTGAYSITVQGKLVYGNGTGFTYEVDIDDGWEMRSAVKFEFDPQTLMRAEDTINYDWYYFVGDWFIELPGSQSINLYVSYDISHENFYSYTNGVEYSGYSYSINTDPITRITTALSSTVIDITPTDTLNIDIFENGTFSYNVSDYARVSIDVDVPQTVIPEVPDSEKITITENGTYNVENYTVAEVSVPQKVTQLPSIFGWVGNVLEGVMTFEIMPNFSLGGVVVILVGLAIIFLILKVFLGG